MPSFASFVAKLRRGLGWDGADRDGGSRRRAKASSGRDPVEEHIRKLRAQGRYAFVLHAELADEIAEPLTTGAWRDLETQMALVPGGVLPVLRTDGREEMVEVAAFHLDRFAVTNEQYAKFVQSGCYEDLELWPREIWPALATQFLDRTRRPGPAFWEHGRPPSGKGQHPVVGVSWHEAWAYSRWVGKRLPTAAEWQKAGSFPEQLSGGSNGTRYPWGDLYVEGRANLGQARLGGTAPVNQFKAGATRNGIYQMTGNTWEWLEDPLDTIPCHPEEKFVSPSPMRRIIGGAFDTYLIHEATNHFITGQPELDRRHNIGFRCAVSMDKLRAPSG